MVRSVLSNTQHLLQNLFAASCCQLVVKPQKISRQTNTLRLCSCSNFWHSCFLPSKCLSCFCQALSLSLRMRVRLWSGGWLHMLVRFLVGNTGVFHCQVCWSERALTIVLHLTRVSMDHSTINRARDKRTKKQLKNEERLFGWVGVGESKKARQQSATGGM